MFRSNSAARVKDYKTGCADNLTQPSCLSKTILYRHVFHLWWDVEQQYKPGLTSSSLLLCSFCCSMRFCRSVSSCFLYFSWSFNCCCWRWGSERFLFSCCSLRNSRRRVDSPGRLTMELKQKASCSMTKHNIKVERIQGALGIAHCPVLANENVSINLCHVGYASAFTGLQSSLKLIIGCFIWDFPPYCWGTKQQLITDTLHSEFVFNS